MNVNKVTVAGNLTRDPELKFTPQGQAVCEVSIAINRRFVQNGETRDEVTFVGLVIWGKRAEAFAKFLRKGEPVYCEGRLSQDRWDDKATGQKREKTKVVVEDWQFVRPKREGERPVAAAPAPAAAVAGDVAPPEDDDVPF